MIDWYKVFLAGACAFLLTRFYVAYSVMNVQDMLLAIAGSAVAIILFFTDDEGNFA